MTNRFNRILIAGLLATAGVASIAQTPPAPASQPMMSPSGADMDHGKGMGERHSGMMGHRMDPAKMQAMIAKRLAELKTSLKVTAAQEGAWSTFTAAMKPPAMDHKRPDPAEMDKLTTPERIDKMRALRAERRGQRTVNMEKREDAVKTFYATLNGDQRKTFDAAHTKMMRRWGGHHAKS